MATRINHRQESNPRISKHNKKDSEKTERSEKRKMNPERKPKTKISIYNYE